MKKLSVIFFALFFIQQTLTAFAAPSFPWQIGSVETTPSDIIVETMPDVFDPNSMNSIQLAREDFEDGIYTDFECCFTDTQKEIITDETSFEGDKSFKIEKENDTMRLYAVFTNEGNFCADDYYIYSCKVKTDSLTVGQLNSAFEIYNGDEYIAGEYFNYIIPIENSEWFYLYQILRVSENANKLKINLYLDKANVGIVYFDDIKIEKIILNPMNVVLLKPVYKGLIYGDGGIGDISSEVIISDYNGYYDLSKLRFDAYLADNRGDVICKTGMVNPSNKVKFAFSSDGLPVGDYYLYAVLHEIDTGEIISKSVKTIRKREENYRPDFYIDEFGRQILNGQPYFFKGVYSAENYITALETIKNTNIDVLSYYGFDWLSSQDYYNNIENSGKKIHISLMNYVYQATTNKMAGADIEKHEDVSNVLTGIVNYYKNNNGLWGYYLFDEVNPYIYGEELRWNNEIISEADINKPTWGVTDKIIYPYGTFTKMADILSVDPYPIYGDENDDVAQVGRYVRQMVKDFPNRPIYAVLQAYNKGVRPPNGSELKNMAWQAICEGAHGIDWFSLDYIKNYEEDGNTYLNSINDIVGEIEQLETIILSTDIAPKYAVSSGEWLNYTVKRCNGKTYLFAVNNTKQFQSEMFYSNGIISAKNISDNSGLEVSNSEINLSFAPLEVKLIEIEQNSNLSAEAKLKNINFYNNSDSYILSDTSDGTMQLNVPEGETFVSFSAEVSKNAGLYINGQETSEIGEINITDLNTVNIRVVAQDGINEKSYICNINRIKKQFSAVILKSQNYLAVLGETSPIFYGKPVFMMLMKNNIDHEAMTSEDIIMCNQTKVNSDGTYQFEVNFTNAFNNENIDISQYILKINLAGQLIIKNMNEVNCNSLIEFDITNKQGTLAPTIVKNDYSLKWIPYSVIVAFYDKNDSLISCGIIKKYSGEITDIQYETITGAKNMKMFLYDNIKNIVPLAKAGEIIF